MTQEANPYVIIAALTFDATGDCALQEAARSAELHDIAELHVVHVVTERKSNDGSDEELTLEQKLARAPEQIQRHVDTIWATKPLKILAHVRTGVPASSILQAAADINADLIVVGTHRRSGMEKLMLGSVAERVLRDAHCPVLIALPKTYAYAPSIEPPCPDCLEKRRATNNQTYWCDRHSRTHLRPHIYEPSDRHRSSGPLNP
jgi:nucleotide-binding universal stress UspA family protein